MARVQSAVEQLHAMTGLGPVKREVDGLIATAIQQTNRAKAGLPTQPGAMHLVFSGNPGTGKTSVARVIGQVYNALGMLPSDKVTEASTTDLIAGFQGQSAIKTRELFNRAKGGVLIVDEAYQLGEDNEYARSAVTELLKLAEDNRDDTVVILAGYKNPGPSGDKRQTMSHLLGSNPGLKSRFTKEIHFPDYSDRELHSIMDSQLAEQQYRPADARARTALEEASRTIAGRGTGNARDARNFGQYLATAQARRTYDDPQARLDIFTHEDVAAAMQEMEGSLAERSVKARATGRRRQEAGKP